MRNRDLPAHPTEVMTDPGGKGKAATFEPFPGLTKRETAAIAAMKGILSRELSLPDDIVKHMIKMGQQPIHMIADLSVAQADALFDKLDEADKTPEASQCELCGGSAAAGKVCQIDMCPNKE